jgi:Clp amino terminal domain, pathogenicity island component
MITLGVADLVVIASRTLGLDTDAVLDLLDPAAAERALAQPHPPGGAAEADPAAPVSLADPAVPAAWAATLLHGLVRQRPLRSGNEQVALAATLQLLALNGWYLDPDPPGPLADMVADIAAGRLGIPYVADWLVPRLRSREAGVKRVKAARTPHSLPLADKIEKLKLATMRTQPKGMFQRFTDRSRRVVYLAQEEARLLRHDHVGPEHLLLGLVYEGEGVAAAALQSLGISLEELRREVEERIGHGQDPVAGTIPFSPLARKVLEQTLREALQLGHNYLGTEHLLLGLFCATDSAAARVLVAAGADHARVREQVVELLAGRGGLADPRTRMVRMNVPDELIAVAEELAGVRERKQEAFKAGHLDAAAGLRDKEKQLRAEKLRLEQQLTDGVDVQAVIAENARVHSELARLRGLLRKHGIEPDAGTAQSA